jgi:hypothetical protein
LIVAREQKKDNIIFRKHHIVIENPTDTITLISFKSGMKYVLPEIRNIFNPEFLKSLIPKSVSLDIRDLPDLIMDELQYYRKNHWSLSEIRKFRLSQESIWVL